MEGPWRSLLCDAQVLAPTPMDVAIRVPKLEIEDASPAVTIYAVHNAAGPSDELSMINKRNRGTYCKHLADGE